MSNVSPTFRLLSAIVLTFFVFVVLTAFVSESAFALTTYYSQTSGNPNVTGNWNTIRGGGGSAPANFTTDNQIFVIQNTHTMSTVSGGWTVSGSGSRVEIESGGVLSFGHNSSLNMLIIQAGGEAVRTGGTFTITDGNTDAGFEGGNDFVVYGTFRHTGTSNPLVYDSEATGVFRSGSTFDHDRTPASGNLPIATWNINSTVKFKATGAQNLSAGNLNQDLGNVTFDRTGLTGTSVWSVAGMNVRGTFEMQGTGGAVALANGTTWSMEGNFIQSGDFRLTNNNTTHTLTVGGNYSMNAGTLNMSGGGNNASRIGILNVGGNFTQASGTTITKTNTVVDAYGEIVFNGSGTQTFTNSGGTASENIRFTVNSGSMLFLGTSLLGNGSTGTFTLSSGATLGIGHADGITTTGATGNVRVSGTRSYNTGANYIYNGSAAQVTGDGLPATVSNLTINNGSGVTLGADRTVNGTLTLTNGVLSTGANTLTVASAGSVSGGSSSSYVNGRLAHIYAGTGSKTFAVGSGSYRPMSLNYTVLTGTSTVTAQNFANGFPGSAPDGTELVGDRYWNVIQSGGSGFTYDITLDGSGLDFSGSPRILKHDSGTTIAHETTEPNYTVTGLNTLSDFAFGDASTPDRITLTGPPSVVAGQTSTNFTIQVVDANGNAVNVGTNTVFDITSEEPGTATITTTPVTVSGGLSSATFTYANTTVGDGTHTVTATRSSGDVLPGGGSDTHDITVSAAAKYLVTASTTSPSAGDQVTITAQLADQHDNPVSMAGQTVIWTKSDSNGSFATPTSDTDANGRATVVFTSHTAAGTSTTVTGTTGEITGTSVTITTVAGMPDRITLTIVTATLPTWTQGHPGFNETLTASGGTQPYVWSLAAESNPLPTGLTLSEETGEISGIPQEAGTYTIMVEVTDAEATIAKQELTMTIHAPLVITTSELSSGIEGQPYSIGLEWTGGTDPYVWSEIDLALPPGLTLNEDTGEISGILTQAGIYEFTVTLTDANGAVDTATLTMTVNESGKIELMLVFITNPNERTEAGNVIGTVVVEAQDQLGNLLNGWSGEVTLSLTPGTGNPTGELLGTTMVTAINGRITFNNIHMERTGEMYTLTASRTGLLDGISDPFTIYPGPAEELGIEEVVDEFGNPIASIAGLQKIFDAASNHNLKGSRVPLLMIFFDKFDNETSVPEGDTPVALTTTSSNGKFFMGQSDMDPVNTIIIPLGQSRFIFYYENPTEGDIFVVGTPSPPPGAREITPGSLTLLIRNPEKLLASPDARVTSILDRVSFTVVLVDASGLTVRAPNPGVTVELRSTTGTGQFFLSPVGGEPVSMAVILPAESSRILYYQDTSVGTHTLTFSGSGVPDPTDTALLTVVAGPALAGQTTAVVPDGIAGEPTGIQISVRDRLGNPVKGVTEDLALTVSDGSNVGSIFSQIIENADETYSVSYIPELTGTDKITITLNGVQITGSPFTSLIGPFYNELRQNYPNPFSNVTNIRYTVHSMSQVKLVIYNILGSLIQTLVDEPDHAPGVYQVQVNGSGLASGMYLYFIFISPKSGEKYTNTQKMIYVK